MGSCPSFGVLRAAQSIFHGFCRRTSPSSIGRDSSFAVQGQLLKRNYDEIKIMLRLSTWYVELRKYIKEQPNAGLRFVHKLRYNHAPLVGYVSSSSFSQPIHHSKAPISRKNGQTLCKLPASLFHHRITLHLHPSRSFRSFSSISWLPYSSRWESFLRRFCIVLATRKVTSFWNTYMTEKTKNAMLARR